MNRRNFLKTGLASAAGVAALNSSALARVTRESLMTKRVIIVGAGLAGMSAAYELLQAGHTVTLLEGRMRAGGRVQTLREPFSEGMYAEAGAMNVPASHDLTLKYIRLLGVELEPIPHSDLGTVFRMRGQQLQLKPNLPFEWPYKLKDDERKLDRRGLWEKYVVPTLKELDDDLSPGWPPASLKKYDEINFADFLRGRGASADAIAIMNLGLASGLGDGAEAVSALDLLREAAHRERFKQLSVIKGGSENFPIAFARQLTDHIQYGSHVTAISQQANGVTVEYETGGARRTMTADRLICAIPFSVLRNIPVTPEFSTRKRQIIQTLQYTSVARVFLQSKKRFWLDQGLTGGAATDLPIMSVYPSVPLQRGTRGILESYTTGGQARRMTGLADSERVKFVLQYMKMVHPAMTENFEGGGSKCWDEDPFARGAYTWFKPGEMFAMMPDIATPEGRIHFAGEHASSSPGWMQGALESGTRAAREVNEAG